MSCLHEKWGAPGMTGGRGDVGFNWIWSRKKVPSFVICTLYICCGSNLEFDSIFIFLCLILFIVNLFPKRLFSILGFPVPALNKAFVPMLPALFSCCFLVPNNFSHIRPRRGGQKVPALTLNVNNFFNIETNATKLSDFS